MTSNISDLVKVKPLEWKHDVTTVTVWNADRTSSEEKPSAEHWVAMPKHLSVDYTICKIVDDRFKGCRCYGLSIGMKDQKHRSLEAAKAAAQADYESRILAALTPAEQPEQCFEVKEGYSVTAVRDNDCDLPSPCGLSEALTIRTVEDVRREAFEQAARDFPGNAYSGEIVRCRIRALIDTPAQSPDKHPDDEAVDRFASAMKTKLAKKRAEGRGGWEGSGCSDVFLSQLLREHVEKGDPVDVGNLAMMLHQRGESIVSPDKAEPSPEPVAWRMKDFADGWIIFRTEEQAKMYAEPVGATVQPLYASPPEKPMSVAEAEVEPLAKIVAFSGPLPEKREWDQLLPETRQHYRQHAAAIISALAAQGGE